MSSARKILRPLLDFTANEATEQALYDLPHFDESIDFYTDDNPYHITETGDYDPSFTQHAKTALKSGWQDIVDYPVANAFELVNLAPGIAGPAGMAVGLGLDMALTPIYSTIRAAEDVMRGRIQTDNPYAPGYIVPHKHVGLDGNARERNWFDDFQDRHAELMNDNDKLFRASYGTTLKPYIDTLKDGWNYINSDETRQANKKALRKMTEKWISDKNPSLPSSEGY